MLHLLQTRAWSEIRSKILLTLGTVFSLELTEQIFQLSLQAEEIPGDPRVRDSKGFVEPLPEYFCTQFEDSDDENEDEEDSSDDGDADDEEASDEPD